MKLVTFQHKNKTHLGILIQEKVYHLSSADKSLPDSLIAFLQEGNSAMKKAKKIENKIKQGDKKISAPLSFGEGSGVRHLAPLPYPNSCRDAYAFRQHVEAARRNRGVPMLAEFDQYPIFYFTNHNAITGPYEDIICMPDHFQKLDFELEAAIVIGKKGRNIKAEDADKYIAGYMIMNDMSARTLQMEEMKLNLGPAKGKDFSTALGPYLVTPDELKQYKISPKSGHVGNNYDLKMKCWVNKKLVSEGSMGDMDWTFAEIIERCSYGCDIFPGDVIGSGTVGTGCFLELNGTGKLNDPNYQEQWLKENDIVEMEITGLGRIRNKIKKAKSKFSILARKKI